ncbi:hypothetical protein LINPERHAP2_LOCUS23638 [Linum perenne]
MAGMLAGVECARRRRCSGGGNFSGEIRRPSLCLYPSNHQEGSASSFATITTSSMITGFEDDNLEDSAREAKERLDKKLRLQRRSSDSKSETEKDGAKSSKLQKLRGMNLKRWLSSQ